MSLNELSEKVGVANVNLSKLKNGRVSAIRFSTLEAICEALSCQPGDILEYQQAQKPLSIQKHTNSLNNFVGLFFFVKMPFDTV